MPEPISSAVSIKALLSPQLLAGTIGAVISLRFATNMNPWERATSVVSGAVMAQYFTPLASNMLGVGEFEQAVGFFIGLFGLSFSAALYETIKKADIWALVVKRFGGGDGNA